MKFKRLVTSAAAIAAITIAGQSTASTVMNWQNSQTSSGNVTAFAYAGAGTTLADVIGEASAGAGVFAGTPFRSDAQNIFLVDFTGTALSDAGVTLFVMWGNSGSGGMFFSGESHIQPGIAVGGNDGLGAPTAGVTEGFGFGDTTVGLGFVSTTAQTGGGTIPSGFAITNVVGGNLGGPLQLNFLYGGTSDIVEHELFNPGGSAGFSGGNGVNNTLLLSAIPLPPAFAWGLAGLGLVIIGRHRMKKRR